MKVSEKERAVISAIELQADAPLKQISKLAGYREHTVRYALDSLMRRNVIARFPFINLHKLGYTIYTVFFSAAAERRSQAGTDSLQNTLHKAPYVLWVGQFGGEYQYGVGFCCRRFQELINYMRELSRKHPNIFFDKAVSMQISSTIFPRRYLWHKKLNVEPVTSTFRGETPIEIDHTDERILSAITTNCNLSHRQLAFNLKIPLSTFELRYKKLREQEIIIDNLYRVDCKALGRQNFKILIYTKGLELNFTKELFKFCARHSEITYLIDLLGVWGYEMGVEVLEGDDVTRIIQELYDTFPGLINTARPLTTFRYSKYRFFPEVS